MGKQNILEIDCIDHKIKKATNGFSFIKEENFMYAREYMAIEFNYKMHQRN